MDKTQMAYFLEVCSCGSITKAGKNLHITPQAVSKAVSLLEKELGYQLLVRSADGCTLTAEGQEARQLCARMMRFNEQIYAQMRNLSFPDAKQEVHIAVWGSFASIMRPDDYMDFQTLYPWITLCVHSYPSSKEAEKALLSGRVDLAFCPSDGDPHSIECLQEYGSAAYIIVNNQSPLSDRKTIRLSDLASVKVIADYTDDGSFEFKNEMDLAGIVPSIILPPLSDPLKRTLVLQGGYAAFSYCPVGWLPYGIVPLSISGNTWFQYSLFAKAADRPLSDAAAKYVDFIVPRFKRDIFKTE